MSNEQTDWGADLPVTDEPATPPQALDLLRWAWGWDEPLLAEGVLVPVPPLIERSMPSILRPASIIVTHYPEGVWETTPNATPLEDLLAARDLIHRSLHRRATAFLSEHVVQALRTRWRGRQASLALQAARLSKRYDAHMVVACAAFDRYYAHPTRRNSRKYNHLLRRACKTLDRYSGLRHYAERRERSAPDWLKEEATK